jgi:hypothetical protein
LTYLALLWGNAALLLAREVGRQVGDPKVRHAFERRGLYVDEVVVHDLTSSLMHPMSWMPFGPAEVLEAARRGLVGETGLYVGVGDLSGGPVPLEELWARVQAYSASRTAATALVEEGGGQFLCPELLAAIAGG